VLKQESPYNNSYPYDLPASMSTRPLPRVKSEPAFPSNSTFAAPAYRNPNPHNIEIRTKFPVARIKRIMQADEEVGKVAQVTPVAVNKALELFMIALVSGAAARTREKGGKRVTAQHLKAVVEGDEQFDFLKEIVEKIADVQENAGGEGRKRKEKAPASDSEEEEKKPKKGKGRKKKSDD
jgi:histone H3/H4